MNNTRVYIILVYIILISMFTLGLARAGEMSRDDLKKALEKNPDLLMDTLKQNKKALFEIVNEAAQEEQARREKEAAEAQKKEYEESFKNPKVPTIDSSTHIRGNKSALFTLVEYSDFQCPYCNRGFQNVETLRKKYGAKLRFIYKHHPLPFHPNAMPAACYFEAAALQSLEKAWLFHDKMFQNQDKLSEDYYKATAKELGLDVARMVKDADSQSIKDKIAADIAEAKKFGFEGTPGFLLNGIPVRGAYPVENFDAIITRLESSKAVKTHETVH